MMSLRNADGFTLTELMVTTAVLAIILTMGFPVLQNHLKKSQLEAGAEDTAMNLRSARQTATRSGFPVVVQPNFAKNELFVFANVDRDPSYNYEPDSSRTQGTVDYEIARVGLPSEMEFGGVERALEEEHRQTVVGFTQMGKGSRVAVFLPDGSIQDSGALRIRDTLGNVFELRVGPAATAGTRVLKYNRRPPHKPAFVPLTRP